jgi:hypothetical protein
MLDFMYGLVRQLLTMSYKTTASQATISLINSVLKEYLPQPPNPQPTYPSPASPSPALIPPRGRRTKRTSIFGALLRPPYNPQTPILDSVSTSPTSAHPNHALIHAQMYAMGDKYLTPDLKSHAKLSFPESVRDISVASLCETITEVYTSTPETDRGLRDMVLDAVIADPNKKIRNKEVKEIAIEIVPQFGYELLERAFGSTNIVDSCTYSVTPTGVYDRANSYNGQLR